MASPAVAITLLLCAADGAARAVEPAGVRLTYEAVGAQAPEVERFEIRPRSVRWLDAEGRTMWHLARDGDVLTLIDHQARTQRRLDADGVAVLRAELAGAHGALAQGASARRPWAAVEAADHQVARGDTARIAGHGCSNVALQAGARTVGESCVADAATVAGGTGLLQLLTALRRLAGQLGVTAASGLSWPLHPLAAAARGGRLPLRVIEAIDGEQRQELRLARVQVLAADEVIDTAPAPDGYGQAESRR